jgi:hypothetical protein
MGVPTYDVDALSQASVDTLRELLRAAGEDAAPTADLNRGVLGDQVLELTAVLAAALELDLDQVRSRGSLQAITDDPTLASDDVVDSVLSNYGVTRREAVKASGQVAVVLNTLQSSVVPQGSVFTFGTLRYVTTDTFVARTSASQVVLSTDRLLIAAGSNWYFLVDVEAETAGATGNLPAGSALTMLSPPGRYVSSYTSTSLVGGAAAETNAELVTRLAAGAAIRSWGSPASLEGMIRDQVPGLVALSALGAGDTEQRRDKRDLLPVSQGGRVDAWLLTSAGYQTKAVTLQATLSSKIGAVGTWQVGVTRDNAPGFYEVEKVLLTSVPLTATGFAVKSDARAYDMTELDYVPDIQSAEEAAYSRYQTAVVQFDDTVTDVTAIAPGATANYVVVFRLLPDVGTLQDYLGDPSRRPLGSDVVTRAAVPIFCTCSFDLVISTSAAEPDLTLVKAAVSAAAGSAFTDRLSASALASAARTIVPAATCDNFVLAGRLRKPSGISVDLAGTQTLTYTPAPADMVSAKTTAFFLPAASVTVTVVRV